MTLQEIKDTYAKSVGYEDWEDLLESVISICELELNYYKFLQEYAKLKAQEALEMASEEAYTVEIEDDDGILIDIVYKPSIISVIDKIKFD